MEAVSKNPTSIRVRKLEPWIIATHNKLAENEGISLEAYFRDLLKEQALKAQSSMAVDLRKMRTTLAKDLSDKSSIDTTALIRSIRDES